MIRILCIGGSSTQGFSKKYGQMQWEETYPYQLEKLLQNYFNTQDIEVINAGQGGYTSHQGLRYLKRLAKYKPDLIIIWFGVNDNGDAFFYEDKEQRIPKKTDYKVASLLECSKTYLLLKTLFKKPRVSPEDYYANYEKILKMSKKNDFKIAFITPFIVKCNNNSWYYLESYRKVLLDLRQKYDCKVLDIPPYLPKGDLNKLFSDICHPTIVGNASIANIVYKQLREEFSLLIGNS